MKYITKLTAVLLCVASIFLLCGCNEGKYNNPIYTEIKSKVVTLDPQLAENQDDCKIVLNIFEGLMRLDINDNLTYGVAEDYRLDGSTYTFTLRKDAKWSDGTPLTADDFVFGLRRAAMKETNAPDFALISSISGAEAVHGGADPSCLGVAAVDQHTLSITLTRQSDDFLYALCSPICMPCNEEFFNDAKGKYGRTPDTVLCNGSFSLTTLNSESGLVRIIRNEYYDGDFTAVPSAVYFTLPEAELDTVSRISKSNIDIGFIEGADIEKAEREGLALKTIYNRYYCVFINPSSVLGDKNVLSALYNDIDRNSLKAELIGGLKIQNSIISRECKAENNSVYDTCEALFPYDKDVAYNEYLAASKRLSGLNNVSILYPVTNGMKEVAGFLATTWQRDLGLFINMTAADTAEEVNSAIENGNYTVAIGYIETSSAYAVNQLAVFKSGNKWGFYSNEYDQYVNSISSSTPFDATVQAVASAQNALLSSHLIIPIVSSPTVMCYRGELGNINYSLYNKATDYSVIMKK